MAYRLTTYTNEDLVEGEVITVTWTLQYTVEDIRNDYGAELTDAEVIAKVKELAIKDFRGEEGPSKYDLSITDETDSEISTFY